MNKTGWMSAREGRGERKREGGGRGGGRCGEGGEIKVARQPPVDSSPPPPPRSPPTLSPHLPNSTRFLIGLPSLSFSVSNETC